MCHSDESRPPGPPNEGRVASQGPRTLTAADGNTLGVYRARAETPRAGMVILPDIRGLHAFYEELAVRFAEAGFDAVAFDYFGRTAGVGHRDDSFPWQNHIPSVTPEHVRADAGAAVDLLREDNTDMSVFTVGFCFGGGQSWRLAASDLGLAGAIGFYGRPERISDVIPKIRAPLLLLVAGADSATPLAEFHDLEATLTAAGKEHEMHVYDGAPHSFFDRAFGEWREACEDAWGRILEFTEAHASG